ncbi:hypothetical protein PGT21_018489 [Puccinia graminis f. sp. tritici]|uniref:Uncharacterized protein n=1 Tax=Puccinia graminis f. sp. tritici TaxID=56615 RepID=A0A5B0LM52_PUCGR|nr:hypothetical protein PGT21_018489 [Puccinia graminis f. sp. tritici]
MDCLFFLACFIAVLQSTLAVPTLAPRADTTASKGQSDQKCWGGLSYYSSSSSSCLGGGTYSSDLLGSPWTLTFGSSASLPYYSLLNNNYPGYGGYYMGRWKKDVADAAKTPSTSLGSPLRQHMYLNESPISKPFAAIPTDPCFDSL